MLRVLYILALFAFFSSVVAQADGGRDLIIQKELNCIDGHLQQKDGLSWNDVCDVTGIPSQQRVEIVNQQMDQLEGKAAPQDSLSEQVPPEYLKSSKQSDMTQNSLSEQVPPENQKPPKKSYFTFEIAPEISHITYREPDIMKEKGDMYGLNGIFTFRPPAGNYLNTEFTDVYRLEGRYSYGRVNYDGGFVNPDGSVIPDTFNGISDYMWEIRGLVGKDFNFNNQSIRLTPYLGGGYRYLFDTMSVNQPGGYNRRIQYLYIPTGVEVMAKLNDGWSIGVDAEYDLFVRGFVTNYLQTLGAVDANNTQTNGFGLRGSIKLIKSWDRFNLILEPFVRYWHIHATQPESDVVFIMNGVPYGLIEPNNTSLEVGGRFGVEF